MLVFVLNIELLVPFQVLTTYYLYPKLRLGYVTKCGDCQYRVTLDSIQETKWYALKGWLHYLKEKVTTGWLVFWDLPAYSTVQSESTCINRVKKWSYKYVLHTVEKLITSRI